VQINVLTAEEVQEFSSDILVGAEILLFSIIHDITDQKQAEAALAFRTRWFLRGLATIVALLLVLVGKLVLSLRQRKTALTALGESQESLATTLNSIGDGVIATNREGRVANMNPVAETLCGWSLAEAKDRPLAEVFNIVHSHTRQPVEDPVQKVLDSGVMVGLANHTMLIARHGRTYQIADSAAPIRDRAGVTTGVVLVFSDVTEKYAQSEKLRRSEELLSEMARQVPGVLFQFYARSNGQKGLYYISEKSETLFGIRAETDGYFERFAAMVLPEYRQGFLVSINKAVADCSNWYYEGVIRKPTGEQIWFSGHSILTQRENETIFNGLLLDITARKRAEKDAEDSRSLLQSVLDTIPVRVFWKDLHLRYLGCNMPFAKDAGKVSPFELIGKDDYAMGWRDQAELYRGDDKAVIEAGAPKLNFEEPQTTPDGRAIFLRTSKIPLRNSQGEIVGVLGTYEDITERKSTEAERAKLQAQLFHAQKMESLGTLAGGVAHDFNNLLQAMGGSIELLIEEKPPGHPDTMRLHTVARSVDRASQLIQQLLLFGRKAEARKIRVDLNHEVKEVFRILERTTPKMIAVTLDLDPDARPLFADPVQIEQILLNLASNAVDAMPQGGRLVVETRNIALDDDFARTHPGLRTGWHVRLSVTDTGCGMGTGVLQHVFDPFFTTKSPGKGTGLGLASVYGIVKAHGGHILCYSEPNQGTTFKVYLPVAEPDAASAAPARRDVPPRGGTETILAVDDEPAIRELAKAALASHGYTVYSAGSGEEALTIYQEYNRSIDLVLLDLNMPGMGGYRCLQELLQLDNAVKVIIASGYSANGPGMEVTSSGARGFIGKPYQLKDLAAKVREVLDDKSSGLQDG
jgi:PAS domain S-box-containing protein